MNAELTALPIEPMLTLDNWATILQVSRRTVERMRAGGELPSADVTINNGTRAGRGKGNGTPRWRAETVRKWMARRSA